MSESNALLGYGTKIEIKRAGTSTLFVELAEVLDVGLPEQSTDSVDVTHYRSPNRTREFILGLIDPGESEIEVAFIPGSAGDDLIRELRATSERVTIRVTFPNAVAYSWSAYVSGFAPTVPIDDRMTASISLRATGPVTVTKPGP